MEDGIKLIFGANTDSDTFDNVFGHLANGYVVAVNGVDVVVNSTYEGGESGLYGYAYDGDREDGLEFDPDKPIGFTWADIESVEIY